MKKTASALAFAFASAAIIATPLPVRAGPATDALGTCLADNTSGKERKTLARWVFIAISAHPAISDASAVTASMRDDADRDMAALVMNLLSERCTAETARAMRVEGARSLEGAFESLGKLAMVELMSNPEVAQSISSYAKHLDTDRLDSILKQQAVQ